MSYTLRLLTKFNVLFQSESPLLYKLKSETKNLLKNICSNYIKVTSLKIINVFLFNHKDPKLLVNIEKV